MGLSIPILVIISQIRLPPVGVKIYGPVNVSFIRLQSHFRTHLYIRTLSRRQLQAYADAEASTLPS